MARLYMTFADPSVQEGKVSLTVSCALVGVNAPAIAFSHIFEGDPTPNVLISTMRDKSLQEVNVYLPAGSKLTNGDIVMFCAPS